MELNLFWDAPYFIFEEAVKQKLAVESIPVFWVPVCVCACIFVVKWDQLIHMIFKIAL